MVFLFSLVVVLNVLFHIYVYSANYLGVKFSFLDFFFLLYIILSPSKIARNIQNVESIDNIYQVKGNGIETSHNIWVIFDNIILPSFQKIRFRFKYINVDAFDGLAGVQYENSSVNFLILTIYNYRTDLNNFVLDILRSRHIFLQVLIISPQKFQTGLINLNIKRKCLHRVLVVLLTINIK